MARIGFIGVGELALYTIKGVRSGGYNDTILLSPRNQQKAALLAENSNCTIMPDNQSLVSNCDYVVISTRPSDCLETLAELDFKPGQVLISVVAGMKIEQLRSVVASDIPIIRAMPVSSAEACASPTLIYPANTFVSEFFDHCGESITVANEDTYEQGSILACVYCWFFSLYGELISATESADLPNEVSAKLVMGMAKGAAELALMKTDQPPGKIAEAIATEGTFSKMGLDLLNQADAFASWTDACNLLKKQLAGIDSASSD